VLSEVCGFFSGNKGRTVDLQEAQVCATPWPGAKQRGSAEVGGRRGDPSSAALPLSYTESGTETQSFALSQPASLMHAKQESRFATFVVSYVQQ
jgi:hypothetical protein